MKYKHSCTHDIGRANVEGYDIVRRRVRYDGPSTNTKRTVTTILRGSVNCVAMAGKWAVAEISASGRGYARVLWLYNRVHRL